MTDSISTNHELFWEWCDTFLTFWRFRSHSLSLLSSSEQPWEASEYLHRLSDELNLLNAAWWSRWLRCMDVICSQSFKLAFWFSFVRGLVYSFSTIYFLASMWFLTNKQWTETLSTAGPACILMQNTYLDFHCAIYSVYNS